VALHHTEMGGELAAFRAVVSATTESVLRRSPSDTSHAEVVGELAAEFCKVEDWRPRLERPTARICDLLLGPLPGQAQLVDRLDEVAGQLRVELATRWEAEQSWRLCELRIYGFRTWF
jgi:hypothetical protein